MALSTRFPVAVHILTVLAAKADEFVSATYIAGSVDTNRVVVSRILKMLIEAGFIVSHQGLRGGSKLAVDPETLSLLDVYKAVEDGSIAVLHEPFAGCPVAMNVRGSLETILLRAEQAFEKSLKGIKLSDVAAPAIKAMDDDPGFAKKAKKKKPKK